MLELRSAIVDEWGFIVCWCEYLTNVEIDEILTNHPEWSMTNIEW